MTQMCDKSSQLTEVLILFIPFTSFFVPGTRIGLDKEFMESNERYIVNFLNKFHVENEKQPKTDKKDVNQIETI